MCRCFTNSLAALHRVGVICPSAERPGATTLASGARSHRWLCLGLGTEGEFGNKLGLLKEEGPCTSSAFSCGREQLESMSEDLPQGDRIRGEGEQFCSVGSRRQRQISEQPSHSPVSTCTPKPYSKALFHSAGVFPAHTPSLTGAKIGNTWG